MRGIERRKGIRTIILFCVLIGLSRFAWAGGGVGGFVGATEVTQLANNAELVLSTAQQAQQIANELQMYANMVVNLSNIPNQVWTTVNSDLQALMRIVNTGQALSFANSNIAIDFQSRFPGFQQSTRFENSYRAWSGTVMDTIKCTLQAANLQSTQFATEEAALNQLRSMSQSAVGRMQALQVGAQIAVEQTAQLQKLRALTMAQMQAQDTYMAAQQQDKDNVKAAEQNYFNYVDPTVGKSYQGY